MPKEISKWPRRNGLSVRKRQRPMSVDLGLVPMTPQTGHCARAASQALLKELLGKGLARRWGEGAPSPRGLWLCCAGRPSLGGKKVPPLSRDWLASAPCQRPLGAATISEIYFGICSSSAQRARFLQQALHVLFRAAEGNKKAYAFFLADREDRTVGLRDAPGSFGHHVDPERL